MPSTLTPKTDHSPDTRSPSPAKTGATDYSKTLRQDLLLLGLLVFGLFFFGLGNYPLFDVDEPRYAEAAREMLERGNWITPYFNYALRLEKPVFFYWLIMASYKLFGINEFAARLVSAVMATGSVAMTYLVARHWVSHRFGLLSALILASSIEVVALARTSITDMTLATFLTGTTLSLFLAVEKNPRYWLLAGIFAGLGILTKGPIGLILPGLTITLYSFWTGQLKTCLLNRYLPMAVVLALAIAAPWYWAAYQENGQIFLDSLYNNNVSRFSGAVDYHPQPVYFYLPVLALGFLPWTPFLPVAVQHGWSLTRRHVDHPLSRITQFAWVWGFTVFMFFTIADTKLLTYILSMFPALALAVASTFEAPTQKTTQGLQKTATVLLGLVGILGILFVTQTNRFLPKETAELGNNPWHLVAFGVLLLGILLTSQQLKSNNNQPVKAVLPLSIAMALTTVVAIIGIVPVINNATQGPMLRFLKIVQNQPLATYEIIRPSLTYYTQRKIPHVKKSDHDKLLGLVDTLPQEQGLYVITKNRFLTRFDQLPKNQLSWKIIEQDNIYSLLRFTKTPQKLEHPTQKRP